MTVLVVLTVLMLNLTYPLKVSHLRAQWGRLSKCWIVEQLLFIHTIVYFLFSICFWCTFCMVFTVYSVINIPLLSQHDLLMTLSFPYLFLIFFSIFCDSIRPWFTSFFLFFSPGLHLPSWTMSWCLAWLFGASHWPLLLSLIIIWPQRGTLCPIWTNFCPLAHPKPLWMSQCAWCLSQHGER